MKVCKVCSKEYSKDSKQFMAYKQSTCRDCYNKMQRDLMHQRITKDLKSYFEYLMKDIVKRGWEVTINAEYLEKLYNEQSGKCTVTGIELKMNKGRNFDSISVDRIDSNKGYIFGNIQIVCLGYNMLKQNWDDETIYLIASKTVEYFDNCIK